jgi:hypothetical protein
MRYFFMDNPRRMLALDSVTKPSSAAEPSVAGVLDAIAKLGVLLARRRATRDAAAETSGPRTLAEINEAAEKLFPRRKR